MYDGFQIRTLVLTMLYRLVPTLIREGYVYIAETPLFEITCKDKTWFAYNETEKADILKTLEGKKISRRALEGPRRERAGDDVAHDDEPRNAPPHQGHAGGRGENGVLF